MDIQTLAVALGYTKKQIEEVKREGFKIQVERDRSILETVGEEKILYLLPKASSNLSSDDGYDEFVYANNKWEWVGKTDVDLSQYALKEDVGDLDDLPTTDKSSLVAAVSETFTSVSNGKAIVASAITDKGVQTSSDATFSEMAQNIENIPSGGGVKEKTVNFYNYTGELVHSYTADEIAELTELPEAPTVQGMTFQTWNWNLADIKSWVQNHDEGSLPVGAVFVTDNGHTRIYMHLREPKMASKEMPFCIQQMAGTVTIDWGDNSQPETITAAGIYSHLWQVSSYPADVMIDIEYVPSGTTKLVLGRAVGSTTYGLFNNETYYASCVEKVEYGNNNDFSPVYSATFKNCTHLKSINIPFGFSTIGDNTFNGCTNLALTVLPDGITSIGNYAFYNCTNLALTVLPDGITSIGGNAFSNCTNLALTVLPDGITSIGGSTFSGCKNLALTVLPDGITSIGGNNVFDGCTNLALTVLPDGVTSISDNAFRNCTNLALTVLPDGVTSIGAGAFNGCTNLALTVLPDGVTSIGGYAFQNCTSLYFIDLTAFTDPQAIPTLANTNAFQGIPATAQFIVANQEMYDAFTTATNWSTYASKFVIEGA